MVYSVSNEKEKRILHTQKLTNKNSKLLTQNHKDWKEGIAMNIKGV
jgi:hypothetical protein